MTKVYTIRTIYYVIYIWNEESKYSRDVNMITTSDATLLNDTNKALSYYPVICKFHYLLKFSIFNFSSIISEILEF